MIPSAAFELLRDRIHFLSQAGMMVLPGELTLSTSFQVNGIEYAQVYVDAVEITAWEFTKPDEQAFLDAIINMLTAEYLAQVMLVEWRTIGQKRFHSNLWLNRWLHIQVVDEKVEELMERSISAEIRRKSAGPKVMRALARPVNS